MTIKSKLTLRYGMVTAAVFTLFALTVYLLSERNREAEFYNDLRSEAVTKTNLFLRGLVDVEAMHSIYLNNREFIDEVEVAVYDTGYNLLYHDAKDIDLVKETPEMFGKILSQRTIRFYEGDLQVIGMVYPYNGKEYIVTAAAYDGYGHAKQSALLRTLIFLWLAGILFISIVGYFLARAALSPVSRIVERVGNISGSNLNSRLEVENARDELGQLSLTFNNMLERLDRSFAAQRQFVSNVSHEIRTPLAALTAELEISLLKEERTPSEYKQTISVALADARNLEQLVSGMLDLARAGYEAGQITMEECRLDEILLDARSQIIKASPGNNIDLIFGSEADDDRHLTVTGNEYLLRTAFSNLIGNNCKFSEDNSSYIQISHFGEYSVLTFSDTGCGIPPEDIPRIFDPFYRGTNSGTVKGHGIGMALVKRIIELHKGTIEVNSHQGEGTVFTVRLPHI